MWLWRPCNVVRAASWELRRWRWGVVAWRRRWRWSVVRERRRQAAMGEREDLTRRRAWSATKGRLGTGAAPFKNFNVHACAFLI